MNKKSDVPTKEGDSISKDDVLDQNPIDETKESGLEEASLLKGEEQERSLSPEEELEELKDRHLRLQADFENVRKRAARDRQEAFNYGHGSLVKNLLGTVDNLERAIQHTHANGTEALDVGALREGVELIYREFIQILERFHVTPVEALGDPFDPAIHEAMAQQESLEVEPNTVIEVFAKGYLLRDRLLRPAQVIVSKEMDREESKGGSDPKEE